MYNDVFKLRLYAIRKELGISQTTVSADTGINQTNISKYETGKLEPNLENLGKLANYYQISTDWLLGNPYNPNEGNVIKTAINELYKEILESIKGADYQIDNKDECINMILDNIEEDRNKILERYCSE